MNIYPTHPLKSNYTNTKNLMSNSFAFTGSWAGLPVPWTPNDQFDENRYRKDIEACARVGIPGIYTCGTTGEFYALDWEEFQVITQTTVQECREQGIRSMIGVTAPDTRSAVKKAAFAAKSGADAIQVAFPFWLELQDSEILPFLQAVSKAADGIPLSLYESSRAKKILTLAQHLEVKSALPNYLMVKGTVGDAEFLRPEGCRRMTDAGIAIFADEGTYWPSLMEHGIQGCCSSFVYYAPQVVMPMNEALANQDLAKLKEGAEKLDKLLQYLIHSVIQRGLYDSAIDRLGGHAIGILQCGLKCRPPYQSATEEDAEDLRNWWNSEFPEQPSNR